MEDDEPLPRRHRRQLHQQPRPREPQVGLHHPHLLAALEVPPVAVRIEAPEALQILLAVEKKGHAHRDPELTTTGLLDLPRTFHRRPSWPSRSPASTLATSKPS